MSEIRGIAGANFNYDRAARILAQCALYGDTQVLKDEITTRQTLASWRKRIRDGDETLLKLVAEKKAILEASWGDKLGTALNASIDFALRGTTALSPKDPDAVRANNETLKVLSTIDFTRKMLDARLAERGLSAADLRVQAEKTLEPDQPALEYVGERLDPS